MKRMMTEKNIKITGLLILYLVSILLSFVVPDFARYNPFVLLAFAIGAFIWYPRVSSKNIILFAACSIIVVFADVLLGVKYVYTAISVANIFFIIASLSNVTDITLSKRQQRHILFFCVIILALFLVGMLSESLYSEQEDANFSNAGGQLRYQGLLHASNISSSVVLMLLVLLWEDCKDLYRKQGRKLKIILAFILLYFVIYYLQSKTRTLFFALPYFAYQIFKVSNVKYLILFGTLALAFLIYRLDDFTFDSSAMRLGEDSSSMTRSYLYLSEIEKIRESNILLPNGSHTMTDYIVKLMADDDYTPHNDFLRYFHDWGLVFLLLIVAIFKYLKKNLETLLIVMLYVGCALHNILLSPYVLFILMLILILNYNHGWERNKEQRFAVNSQKV